MMNAPRCDSHAPGEAGGGAARRRLSRAARAASLMLCVAWLGCVTFWLQAPAASESGGAAEAQGERRESTCLACHRKESGRAGEVVNIHLGSTHSKAQVGCEQCHGGDALAAEKGRAHAVNFVGKMGADETLARCGGCHRQALAEFRLGRHASPQRGVRRLDCAECHGVHSIGSPPASFSFATFCAGCHGLEYLPALPAAFQEVLALSDELREAARGLEARGKAPSADLARRRKEIRRLTSEVVHPTDLTGRPEKIPRILELGRALKREFESEK